MKKQKLKFVRGDDVSYRLFFRQLSGELLDVSDIRFDLHVIPDDRNEPVIQLSSLDSSIEVVGMGEIIIHFSHRDTAEADWDMANYDLQLIDAQGKRKTVMSGRIELILDYTRI